MLSVYLKTRYAALRQCPRKCRVNADEGKDLSLLPLEEEHSAGVLAHPAELQQERSQLEERRIVRVEVLLLCIALLHVLAPIPWPDDEGARESDDTAEQMDDPRAPEVHVPELLQEPSIPTGLHGQRVDDAGREEAGDELAL